MEDNLFDVYIDFDDEETGVDKISLVKKPAIMSNFIYMNQTDLVIDRKPDETKDEFISRCIGIEVDNGKSQEQAAAICYSYADEYFSIKQEYLQLGFDGDKKVITGPALIPDLEIYRRDGYEEYYIKYDRGQIEKIVQKFFKEKDNYSVNRDHKKDLQNIWIYESWITSKNDKSKDLGLDVPEGTWMVSMKIENDELWENIKNGKLKGFSIEGLFKFRKGNRKLEQKIWSKRGIDSANVDTVVFEDELNELVVKFNDGSIYTYSDIDINEFLSVVQGLAECKTEGSNKWGSWFVGKTPSVGAAIWDYLIRTNKPYKKGGSVWQEEQTTKNNKIKMTETILKNGMTIITEGTFEVGAVIWTMDGESQLPVEPGEYETEAGDVYVVGDNSTITEIKPLEVETPTEEQEQEGDEKVKAEINLDELKAYMDPILTTLMEKIDALAGLIGMEEKFNEMEAKLEALKLEKEMKEVQTIDKKVVKQKEDSDARYNFFKAINKKF